MTDGGPTESNLAHAEAVETPQHPPGRPRGVLYPNQYVWFVFLAVLDILCTWLILNPAIFGNPVTSVGTIRGTYLDPNGRRRVLVEIPAGADEEPRGEEVNPIAAWVIQRGGLPGKVLYKFALVLMIVSICEYVGRRRYALGKRIAEWAVALTAIPVAVALFQMAVDTWQWLVSGPLQTWLGG